MGKIASELGSQQDYVANDASSVYRDTAREYQVQVSGADKLQSLSQMMSTEPAVSDLNGLAVTQTIFEDKKESVKSQVEKLANTRKEIKKLIKI